MRFRNIYTRKSAFGITDERYIVDISLLQKASTHASRNPTASHQSRRGPSLFLSRFRGWEGCERLQPLFDEQSKQISAGEKENKERCWTLENVLSSLKSIQRNEVEVAGAKFYLNTTPDAEAQRIIDLLNISVPKL
jgi:hypothetical protein